MDVRFGGRWIVDTGYQRKTAISRIAFRAERAGSNLEPQSVGGGTLDPASNGPCLQFCATCQSIGEGRSQQSKRVRFAHGKKLLEPRR